MTEHIIGNHEPATIDQMRKIKHVTHAVLHADAHYGYGHPIGCASEHKNYINISGVGSDIGCGNSVACIGKLTERKQKAFADTIQNYREYMFGKVTHGLHACIKNKDIEITRKLSDLFEILKETRLLLSMRDNHKWIEQIASLGGGNHYISLMKDENNDAYIVTHCGSRSLGHEMDKLFHGIEETKDNENLVVPYKENGKELGNLYYKHMQIACHYAKINREMITQLICIEMKINHKNISILDTNHNTAIAEGNITRSYKGCTPITNNPRIFMEGGKEKPIYIGGSVKEGGILINPTKTKDNTLNSLPHGTGRTTSRNKIKKELEKKGITMETYKEELQQEGITLYNGSLDETHYAYRSLNEIMKYYPNAKIIRRLKTVICMMA